MLTPRGNLHSSKLPRLGAIVTVRDKPLQHGHRYRRFIVEAFPLNDSANPKYSRGIHTVWLRALDNGWRIQVAGHWCEEEPT